jgi:hypothetical protein
MDDAPLLEFASAIKKDGLIIYEFGIPECAFIATSLANWMNIYVGRIHLGHCLVHVLFGLVTH